MHWFQRHLTLKGRIILFLTAFFAALMVQMYVNHYQSNVVLDQLGRQTGNFHSISQFSSGISRQLTALEKFRWENGDANALMQTLQSGSSTADTWLWRIDGDLREVGEEQYLLAQAVRTTYENYDRLMDELQTDLKRGDTEEAAALYYGEVTLCGGYLQQYTDELLQTAITEGQSTYTRLSALNERLKGVQAVTTLLCVLLGALFVRTVWHLLDPVQQMIVTSRAIGRGELDTPDVIVQQTDEIGHLAGAFNTMKHCLTTLYVPELAANAVTNLTSNPILIALLLNLILLVLGCIMDMAPIILIATPILLPIATSIGIDPIQFGIMVVLNCGIGLLTPPVGAVLFIGSAVAKRPMEKVVKATLPFYLCMIVALLLITFIPDISLFIPKLCGYVPSVTPAWF